MQYLEIDNQYLQISSVFNNMRRARTKIALDAWINVALSIV